MTLDLVIFPGIYLSIKWFQDVTNALFKMAATPLNPLDSTLLKLQCGDA